MGGGRERILGQTATVGVLTAVSRVLGYFRDRAVASLLGTSYWADAFYIALRIPNTFRRFVAEGAMTASLVPVLSASFREDPPEDAWLLARRFLSAFSVCVALLGALGSLSAPLLVRLLAWQLEGRAPEVFALTERLTALLFPYVTLVALSAVASGILNSRDVFAPPALTPALLNLSVILAAVLFAGGSARPAVVLAWGVLAGGLVQVLFQVPFLLKAGMSFRPAISLGDLKVRRVFALMVPGMLGAGAGQITVLVGTALAHTAGEGAVSALYYANRVAELAFGLFAVSLSVVILPRMSREASEKDREGLSATMDYALGLVSFVLIPAAAGLLALPTPIVAVLFETGRFSAASVQQTVGPLVAYALGLPLWGVVSVLVRTCHARQDMGTPLRAGLLSLAAFTAAALALLPRMGAAGIAAASTGSALLNASVLAWGLSRSRQVDFRWAAAGLRLARLVSLSAAMALAVWGLQRLAPQGGAALRALFLFGSISCGMLLYGAGAILLGYPEAQYLRDLFWRLTRR